jgi:hypothetical protein
LSFEAFEVVQLISLFLWDIAVTGCLLPTVFRLHSDFTVQGSVVQFFIGYLMFEDEATMLSQTGAKHTPSDRVTIPEEKKFH